MIDRSGNVKAAMRSRQRGFIINPFRFGGGGGGGPFFPDSGFFAGDAGFAFDPLDYATMFQDSSGSTPVTGASDPLGRINDLSGNGNNRTSSGSLRPAVISGGLYQFTSSNVMDGAANTAAGGAWTYILSVDIGATTQGVILDNPGNVSGTSFLPVYQSGSGSTMVTPPPTTFASCEVNGASVTNTRGALYTALNGARRTMVLKLSGLDNGSWTSTFRMGGYGAGFSFAGIVGREILINRDLTGGSLADAVAWVGAY